jgi:hypothetical protein
MLYDQALEGASDGTGCCNPSFVRTPEKTLTQGPAAAKPSSTSGFAAGYLRALAALTIADEAANECDPARRQDLEREATQSHIQARFDS